MKNVIITAGFIDFLRFKKDRSATIAVETQELSDEKKRTIGGLGGEFVYFLIKKEPFTEEEVEFVNDLKTDPIKKKKKSETLRQILWRDWKNDSRGYDDFQRFYEVEMDRFITQVRERL
jgi:hypothetical protein